MALVMRPGVTIAGHQTGEEGAPMKPAFSGAHRLVETKWFCEHPSLSDIFICAETLPSACAAVMPIV